MQFIMTHTQPFVIFRREHLSPDVSDAIRSFHDGVIEFDCERVVKLKSLPQRLIMDITKLTEVLDVVRVNKLLEELIQSTTMFAGDMTHSSVILNFMQDQSLYILFTVVGEGSRRITTNVPKQRRGDDWIIAYQLRYFPADLINDHNLTQFHKAILDPKYKATKRVKEALLLSDILTAQHDKQDDEKSVCNEPSASGIASTLQTKSPMSTKSKSPMAIESKPSTQSPPPTSQSKLPDNLSTPLQPKSLFEGPSVPVSPGCQTNSRNRQQQALDEPVSPSSYKDVTNQSGSRDRRQLALDELMSPRGKSSSATVITSSKPRSKSPQLKHGYASTASRMQLMERVAATSAKRRLEKDPEEDRKVTYEPMKCRRLVSPQIETIPQDTKTFMTDTIVESSAPQMDNSEQIDNTALSPTIAPLPYVNPPSTIQVRHHTNQLVSSTSTLGLSHIAQIDQAFLVRAGMAQHLAQDTVFQERAQAHGWTPSAVNIAITNPDAIPFMTDILTGEPIHHIDRTTSTAYWSRLQIKRHTELLSAAVASSHIWSHICSPHQVSNVGTQKLYVPHCYCPHGPVPWMAPYISRLKDYQCINKITRHALPPGCPAYQDPW